MRKTLSCLLCLMALSMQAQIAKQTIQIKSGDIALTLMVGNDNRLYQLAFGHINHLVSIPEKMPSRESEFFPCYGNGYIAHPALKATHTDGNTSTDLHYLSHQTDSISDGSTQTVIHLKDPQYAFFADIYLKCFPQYSIMEMWTTLHHDEGGGEVLLDNYASASPLLDAPSFWLTQFNGRYKHEATMEEEQLHSGIKVLESNLGTRANYYGMPSVILSCGQPAHEEEGEVLAASLKWAGNYQLAFDYNWSHRLRVIAGINPLGAQYHLSRGESFTTPAVVWVYSRQGKGELSRRMHRWADQYVIRDSNKDRPVLLNNWEATHCNFDEQRLVGLFDEARKIGAELFLLDDGWFGNGQYARNDDKHGLGDWQPDSVKLPHGLSYLSKMAGKRKIGFGIWLEPEMVNPLSKCYVEHPDWIITQKGRDPILGRHQEILDLTRPEVQQFERSIFKNTLVQGISYVKWDCNRFVTQPGSSYLPAKMQSHLLIDYNRALYALMNYFATSYPDVMAMLCAGGSGRIDYGSMQYFHSFWPSDNTDPIDRIKIQWGFSHFFPAKTISAHVTRMGKRHLKLAIDVALSGAFGVDMNITTASKEEKEQLAMAVKLYKSEIRPLIMQGDLYRLSSPYSNPLAALSYVSPDQSTAVLYLYQTKEGESKSLCLRGLKPDAYYTIHEAVVPKEMTSRYEGTYTGKSLMEKGISTLLSRPYESALILIKENK